MSFLSVHFKGGLGNQLFQYANARSICIQKNISHLYFDLSEYENESLGRSFSLSHYKIKGTYLKPSLFRKLFILQTKANRILSSVGLFKLLNEKGFRLQAPAEKIKVVNTIKGYWQSEYYFKKIRKELLEELVPVSQPPFPQWLNHENTIAVHVRRTDYLTEPRYGFLGSDYYRLAIDYFKMAVKEPLFIIFSDDLNWCKTNLHEENFIFFEEETWQADYLQLYLMSKCKHQIVANSSFSWWAAWLNNNKEKIVLRPKVPFKDPSLLYESHYPEKWIAINN